MDEIVSFIVESTLYLGYWGIVLLMGIESSFIPFPSEVVMVPAGYLAYKGEMDFSLVVISGVAGSLLGAMVNYYLALFVGRPFLNKYGTYFFLNESKLDKVDAFFEKHGSYSTFIGRLIPVIRQLISIPAGMARMNIKLFAFYTGLGAAIWVLVLTSLGYFLGHNEELIKEYKLIISAGLVAGLAIMTLIYVLYKNNNKRGKA